MADVANAPCDGAIIVRFAIHPSTKEKDMKRTKKRLLIGVVAATFGIVQAPLAQETQDSTPAAPTAATSYPASTAARWYGPDQPGLPCPYFPAPGGPCYPF